MKKQTRTSKSRGRRVCPSAVFLGKQTVTRCSRKWWHLLLDEAMDDVRDGISPNRTIPGVFTDLVIKNQAESKSK